MTQEEIDFQEEVEILKYQAKVKVKVREILKELDKPPAPDFEKLTTTTADGRKLKINTRYMQLKPIVQTTRVAIKDPEVPKEAAPAPKFSPKKSPSPKLDK
jgi:hypothetical protein